MINRRECPGFRQCMSMGHTVISPWATGTASPGNIRVGIICLRNFLLRLPPLPDDQGPWAWAPKDHALIRNRKRHISQRKNMPGVKYQRKNMHVVKYEENGQLKQT